MSTVTIAAGTIPLFEGASLLGADTLELRIYSNGFFDSAGLPIVEGSPHDLQKAGFFFKRVALTIGGTTLSYALFTLPSTTDSIDRPLDARWSIYIFNATKQRVIAPVPGLESFRLPPDTPTDLDEIRANQLGVLPGESPRDVSVSGDLSVAGDVDITGNLTVLGTIAGGDAPGDTVTFAGPVTAPSFIGNGAGLTGVPTGAGGVSNTGSTTIAADTDIDGVGIIDLQTRTVTRFRVNNDGSLDTLGHVLKGLLRDKGGAVYNVKAYGATGDGVTDDTTAIISAITAAEAAGGGKVFFPEGEYHVEGSGTEIFLITKALTIEGVGWNSRIIVDSAVPTTRDVFRVSPAIDLNPNYWEADYIFHTIRKVNIYPESGTPARYGILFDTLLADQSMSRALVEECAIANMGSGYAIASLNAASPDNNGTAGLTIRRCQIRGGLYMRPIGDHFHLENNSIGGTKPIDIEQYSGAAGMVISGNVIVNDEGFILRSGINPKILNNYFETPSASALIQYFVDLAGAASTVIDTPIFSGNTVSILGGSAVDAVRFNYTTLGHMGEGNWIQNVNAARSSLLISANAVNTIVKAVKYSGAAGAITNGGTGTRFEKLDHGTIPTIAAGAGAGTGPTIAILGNDRKGRITLTTGSAPSASAVIATITFLTSYDAAPYVGVFPANAAAAALSGAGKAYAPSTGVTATTFTLNSGSTQLAATTQYIWWYDVDD